jgi:hypothetical protein
MTCTTDCFSTAVIIPHLQQEASSFFDSDWLPTDIHDFTLSANTSCSKKFCGFNERTPTFSPDSLTGPLYNLTTHSNPANFDTGKAEAPAWWESNLACDIHHSLLAREECISTLQLISPQLCHRRELVDFVFAICIDLCISCGTRHLAIKLMDHFMDGHNVMEYRLRLVALTCVLIAAKFEEEDKEIPTIDMLQHSARLFGTYSYSRREIHMLELYILKYFKWCVSFPSAAHFIDLYHHTSNKHQSENTSCPRLPLTDNAVLEKEMQEYCKYFLDISLKDNFFLAFKSSHIAASIVCVARIFAGLGTAWNSQLQKISSYSLEDLQPIANYMLSLADGLNNW